MAEREVKSDCADNTLEREWQWHWGLTEKLQRGCWKGNGGYSGDGENRNRHRYGDGRKRNGDGSGDARNGNGGCCEDAIKGNRSHRGNA